MHQTTSPTHVPHMSNHTFPSVCLKLPPHRVTLAILILSKYDTIPYMYPHAPFKILRTRSHLVGRKSLTCHRDVCNCCLKQSVSPWSLPIAGALAMTPRPIAFIVFGEHEAKGKIFWDLVTQGKVKCRRAIDIRKVLNADPAEAKKFGCTHINKGESDQVQSNLLNQWDTVEACEWLLEEVETGEYVAGSHRPVLPIPVYCTAGRHRSDGASTMVQRRVLNCCVRDGKRLYNANVFRITDCHDPLEQAELALTWVTDPWEVIDGEDNFGKRALSTSPLAVQVWDAVTELKTRMGDDGSDFVPMPPSRPPPNPKKRPTGGSGSGRVKPTKAPRSSKGHGIDDVDRDIDDVDHDIDDVDRDIDDTGDGHGVEVSGAVADAYVGDCDNWDDGSYQCPCCGGTGLLNAADRPEWATRVTTVDSLVAMLESNGLDERAIHQAVLVMQEFGDEGLDAIRGILVNMFKNWEFTQNPSAYMASACIKYRRQRE